MSHTQDVGITTKAQKDHLKFEIRNSICRLTNESKDSKLMLLITPGIPIRRPRAIGSHQLLSWYVKSDFMNIWRVNPVLSS